MSEVVYFVKAGDAVKIGFSRDVSSRIKSLSTGASLPLELLATVPGGPGLERALHKQLHGIRLNGEWFRDCDELRAAMAEPPDALACAPKSRPTQYTAPFMAKARELFPINTAEHLSEITDACIRTVYRWLADDREMTVAHMLSLIWSDEYGADFMAVFCSIIPESARDQWIHGSICNGGRRARPSNSALA